MPKISIITPTFNSGGFISRTINSVINQAYEDWELLIIDDNSTDNTVEIVQQFIKQDSRIKLYKTIKNSGGPASPKNIGIEKASGKYVAFLDHDDEWLSEKLDRQLRSLELLADNKIGLIYSFVNIKNNNDKLLSKYNKSHKGNSIKDLANGNFIITSSCVIVEIDVLKKVGIFDSNFKIFDDWDMWLRISEAGFNFYFIPEYLINYIYHGGNACRGNNSKNIEEFVALYEKHRDTFLKYNLKEVGLYYFYKKDYYLSRKYYIRHILKREVEFRQKLISLAYIVLSFFPRLESIFKKIFLIIKY